MAYSCMLRILDEGLGFTRGIVADLSKAVGDLQRERSWLQAQLNALDKAISVLSGLSRSRGRRPRR
jgi:hypothetical protein